jgi:hypothetical protein
MGRDRRAATVAEFALVLPIALLFLFGIIDAGRLMWTLNSIDKATQWGARWAVATSLVPTSFINYSYVGVGGLTQGDAIPASSLGKVTCTSAGCTCATAPCPVNGDNGFNTAAFDSIVAHMNAIDAKVTAPRVSIDYTGAGIGYAGDPTPDASDIAPLVTVRVTGLTFVPILGQIFGVSMNLPPFSAALTLEDGVGTYSN